MELASADLLPPGSLGVLQLARLQLRLINELEPIGCASCGALDLQSTSHGGPSKRQKTTRRSSSRTHKGAKPAAATCAVCGESPSARIHPSSSTAPSPPNRPRTRRSSAADTQAPPAPLVAPEPPLEPSSPPRKPPILAAASAAGSTPSALLSPTLVHVPLSEPETPSVAPPPPPPAPAQTTSQGGTKRKGRGRTLRRGKGSPLEKVLAVGGQAVEGEVRAAAVSGARHSTRLDR